MRKKVVGFTLSTMLFALCSLAEAQQANKIRTIGFLGQAGGPTSAYEVFRQTLRDLGWIEGINVTIEHRPGGDDSRLAEKAAELVRLKVDTIVTTGGPSTRVVQQATTTIPIVFASSGDPIESGLIESLARPGKNLTGITYLAYELVGKRLELLKEAAPIVSRVAVIANPGHPGEQRELRETQSTARSLGITLGYHQVRTNADYDGAFEAILKDKANGILVFPEGRTLANAARIVEFVVRHRLPGMYGWKEYVEGSGLMSYGPNRDESYRRIAVLVDKILKGWKPAELPTELPKTFELVFNLKAAKQINLTIPPNVLARADKVIK
jgi:putative tryptophan/tyrosine transport system substrate-binding protein